MCACLQGYESMKSSGKWSMGGKGRVRDTDGPRLQNVGKNLSKINGLTLLQSHNITL